MHLKEVPEVDHTFKAIILGDHKVGKSSLLTRFTGGNFNDFTISTMGIDFKSKIFQINGLKIKIQIWDTAGQEKFTNLATSYYQNSKGILLCFDNSQRSSFNNVENWIEQIKVSGTSNIPIFLVATKLDLESEIEEHEAQKLAQKYKMVFWRTSSKTLLNVNELFEDFTNKIVTNEGLMVKREISKSFKLSVEESENIRKKAIREKKHKCC